MTQLQSARKGALTPEIVQAAAREGAEAGLLLKEVAAGRAVVPANINHKNLFPAAIGRAFNCKINVNLGTSGLDSGLKQELKKLALAAELGADAVMDLSTGGDLPKIRKEIIKRSPMPVGTVPMYDALKRAGGVKRLTPELLLEVIEEHAEAGVDFMTVHAGLLRRHLPLVRGRTTGIVSRGGAALARWMELNKAENPLYERFGDLCAIFRKYDVTFSLGDGLRPGSLADACDAAQFAELDVLGKLVKRSRAAGVQVMVEGPGHVPLDKVFMNVERAHKVCHGAPFYVLGPLVTDIAAGYDHINSAIGGALAAWAGASFLCYVTPKEHLGLPGLEDVRQGIIASKIAAHAADIARGRPGAIERDHAMSKARYAFDWEKQFSLSLDPRRARCYRGDGQKKKFCNMCGPDFCSMRQSRKLKVKA
ncbi:MAG: phosphomethylpyrimidine synthase [Elusimicrobia bacterium GWB2_63_16]|nr:MAG: phosphomethylpyrimidine synthase [Elusimicrobia bacterium GWB2_63_16]